MCMCKRVTLTHTHTCTHACMSACMDMYKHLEDSINAGEDALKEIFYLILANCRIERDFLQLRLKKSKNTA